jgi:bZIP transcription factor
MPTSRDRGNYQASHPKNARSKERNRDAQRAYRLRQTATIKSLTRQVQNLEKAVEGMSETVVDLVDGVSRIEEISKGNAEASRICEKSLARTLGLVRGLEGGDGDEDDHSGEHSNDYSANEVGDGGHENEGASVVGSFEPPIRTRSGSINLLLSPNSAWDSASEANQDNPQLRETTPGGESHRARISPYAAQAAHILATIRGGRPHPQSQAYIFRPVLPPSTYSFLEKTFSRRLQRASLERAVQILHHVDPVSDKTSTFRFSNSYLDFQLIENGILELLSRPMSDTMDNHSAPILNVGGSGTHFPRLDIPGNPRLDPNQWIAKAFARHSTKPVPPDDPQLRVDVIHLARVIRTSGLEGEWFDANDVEQYLRCEKGVRLTDATSVAMVAPLASKKPYSFPTHRVVRSQPKQGPDTQPHADYITLPFFNFSALKQAQSEKTQSVINTIHSRQRSLLPSVDLTKLINRKPK